MDGKFRPYGSGGSSRAFYLSAFNGGPYLKDRVGKGTRDDEAEIRVENLALISSAEYSPIASPAFAI